MNWLFVLAHPDDEADVGGTIYRLSTYGEQVAVAIMVKNAAARSLLSPELADEEKQSMNILGVSKTYHADFPNIKMNIVPHLELVQFVESCVSDWQADAIVTHNTSEVNDDHVLTAKAVIAASRLFQRAPDRAPRLKLLLMCESSGSTEWSLDNSVRHFTPNFYVEIGRGGLEKKWEAFCQYSGVARSFPHPYSKEVFESLAAYRGTQSGYEYAEAFECVFSAMI